MRVQILMSTYNGSAYLEDQLASIDDQSWSKCDVLIRDDGSTDDTARIAREHRGRTPIHVIRGTNMGPAASFMELLARSDEESSFFAFCDQDDVWLNSKLARAVSALEAGPNDAPALYCSGWTHIDALGRPIGQTTSAVRRPSFSNSIFETIAPGCTMVLNRRARDLLVYHLPDPSHLIMHDRWVYQVISGAGVVSYDPEPSVQCRRHQANATGSWPTTLARSWGRIERFAAGNYLRMIRTQAHELHRVFGSLLSQEARSTLAQFLGSAEGLGTRLRFASTRGPFRQEVPDDIVFRFLVGLGIV